MALLYSPDNALMFPCLIAFVVMAVENEIVPSPVPVMLVVDVAEVAPKKP